MKLEIAQTRGEMWADGMKLKRVKKSVIRGGFVYKLSRLQIFGERNWKGLNTEAWDTFKNNSLSLMLQISNNSYVSWNIELILKLSQLF